MRSSWPGQLAADAAARASVLAVHRRGERDQERGSSCGTSSASKPCGKCSAMKPVLKSPATNFGCASSAAWNGMLLRDAADDEGVERLAHPRDRVGAVAPVHDQLGDHRVVVHRDLAAFGDAGVHAHAAGRVHRRRPRTASAAAAGTHQPARCDGRKLRNGSSALMRHSMAQPSRRTSRLRERQLLAGGDADHQLDQVEPGDALGHRVLDLQPGVHLEEVEALVLADHELHRAGALVVHRPGERHRLLAHRLARRVADEGRRRLLDHLLVAALDRALALVQVDDVAVRVAEHLDLDVARLLDELLDEDAVVAEAVARLVAAGREALEGLLVVVGDAQALAAAAGDWP